VLCCSRARDKKKDEKADGRFKHAIDGLELISTSGVDALNCDQLRGVLLVHNKKAIGKKAELKTQLCTLLAEKMAKGAAQSAVVAEMKRLTAAAAAARLVNDHPLELPAPAEDQQAPPLLLHGPQA
jgi:hypothetical protein